MIGNKEKSNGNIGLVYEGENGRKLYIFFIMINYDEKNNKKMREFQRIKDVTKSK